MISNKSKTKFVQIIAHIKSESAINCTHQEYADTLGVSRRKFTDFMNGKNFDFWLLEQYAALNNFDIFFGVRESENIYSRIHG